MTAGGKENGWEPGYVRAYKDRVTEAYISVIREKDAGLAGLVETLLALGEADGSAIAAATVEESERRAEKRRRMKAYERFWDGLTPQRQLELAQEYAKILTIARNTGTIAVTDVIQAHNAIKATTAGSIDYVLRRFREEDVAPSQVQTFLNENAVAWFSLTAHPTNPATVAYSLAEIDMTAVLANSGAPPGALAEALRRIRDTPIVGDRKTPVEEATETLGTLKVIYNVAIRHRDLFVAALEKYGYAAEGVRIQRPLIRASIWALGDGDGNPAMTAEVLGDGLALYRREIKALYMAELRMIRLALHHASANDNRSVYEKKLGAIEAALNTIDAPQARLPNLEGLAEQIGAFSDYLKKEGDFYHEAAGLLDDLAYRLQCFGFCFATIDVRHNARDIVATAARVLEAGGLTTEKAFGAMSDLEKASALARWLGDADAAAKCANLDIQAGDDDGATARRVYKRLQVIGRNPDACAKLIIAEATSAAQALAALFLLKATGNEVANQRSRIDIVALSESSADLSALGGMLEALLDDETYRAHVVARGVLLAMIAKSDTTRQDGRGKAEFSQHEGAVSTYASIDRMKGKYPELEHVRASVMNGGGLALQRGGGRVTETPALHGLAAADARVYDMGPSTLTIQGHQQRILFAPDKTAIGTLEALAAMNLYSKAGIQGEMPPPDSRFDINKPYARMDAWVYSRAAGESFDHLIKDNPSIDELLVKAPWLSMKAGNVSSRPGKRGEKLFGPGVTPREAKMGNKGENPKALQGRAISGERLVGHACVPVFTILGLAEAMEIVEAESPAGLNREKYGDPLHHLYKSHKMHRDGARVNINAAPIADFDIAWPLLAGRERPERPEVIELANRFRETPEPHANPPEVTLAFLEEYFLRVEKLTYQMVTGVVADEDFRHGDGLRLLWPELAEQVEYRNRCAEFARVIEMKLTRHFDHHPDTPLDERMFRIVQAIYTAADVIDAPTGIEATRTRLEPMADKNAIAMPGTFSEAEVRDRLKLPGALGE
jgi:phosphoenolpyruvate carboxylase